MRFKTVPMRSVYTRNITGYLVMVQVDPRGPWEPASEGTKLMRAATAPLCQALINDLTAPRHTGGMP
jgi:hypothetical protein